MLIAAVARTRGLVVVAESKYRREAVPGATNRRLVRYDVYPSPEVYVRHRHDSKIAPPKNDIFPTYEELQTAVVDAIDIANQVCEIGTAEECAVAWDIVEELSAAAADAKPESLDPLDSFCENNPDAEECKMFDV